MKGRTIIDLAARREARAHGVVVSTAGSHPADPRSNRGGRSIRPIAHICDVHVPDHDTALWRSFLEWCRDESPREIIVGGDFLELGSCSQHGGVARPAMLVEDIQAGREALAELRSANRHCEITYLEGNHETRLRRKVVHDIPELDGALDLPSMLDLKKLRIDWHKYGDVIYRGKLGFTHGWWCPEHHAAKHLREVGTSIAYGHTHRSQVHTRGVAGGDVRGAFGEPCMRRIDEVDWLDGKPSGWTQGFGVIYVRDDGRFNLYQVLSVGGAFVWNGAEYGDAKAQRRAA